MFWGLSEALDLLSEYLNIFEGPDENTDLHDKRFSNDGKRKEHKKEINILLFGASDPRHIIKTAAKLYTHSSQRQIPILKFYVVDGCVETIARSLILLGIALENANVVSLRTKVHLFMDIYGNSLMAPSTQQYLLAKAKSLLKIVTDDYCLKKLAPLLNFDRLKYRERDCLANTFEFWFSKQNHAFNIQDYWNCRLRKEMGSRYDFREGLYDWDLNMALKERGGKQICPQVKSFIFIHSDRCTLKQFKIRIFDLQEYRYWRETGIAFIFPEYEYSRSNKTLASGLIRNGDKFIHKGYAGDIKTGPFAGFGLKSNDQNMLKSVHGENDYRATDVTERNLLELFHEVAAQTAYEHDTCRSRKYGAVRFKMGKCLTNRNFDIEALKEYNKPWIFLDAINISFLSPDDIFALQQNLTGQWTKFFDIAFVGYNYFAFLEDRFLNILSRQSLLIVETILLSTARREEVNKFGEKILIYAKRNNLKEVMNYNGGNSKNPFLKFKNSFDFSQ